MKSFAILPVIALLSFAPAATADHPVDAPASAQKAPNVKSLKDIKLPTQDEIAKMKQQMPDMNGMMKDMMGMMQDEDFKSGMKNSMDAFKDKLDGEAFKKQDDGLPDMNAMMGAMLDLFGDEEFMGGLVEQIEPMAKMMEKHVPEAAKKTAKPAETKKAKPDWN